MIGAWIAGASLFTATVIFTTLKLTGVAAWSWLWVLSPVWGAAGLVLGMFLALIMWRS